MGQHAVAAPKIEDALARPRVEELDHRDAQIADETCVFFVSLGGFDTNFALIADHLLIDRVTVLP